VFYHRNLAGANEFACDCNVYNSIVAVIDTLTSTEAAECQTPPHTAGAKFYDGGSYESFYPQRFLCSKTLLIKKIYLFTTTRSTELLLAINSNGRIKTHLIN